MSLLYLDSSISSTGHRPNTGTLYRGRGYSSLGSTQKFASTFSDGHRGWEPEMLVVFLFFGVFLRQDLSIALAVLKLTL